jgi:hypothetical protein
LESDFLSFLLSSGISDKSGFVMEICCCLI